jgi:hypothetical protein
MQTTRRFRSFFALGLLASACGMAGAQPAVGQSRGEMLYTTHCVACHSTQMHWRDKRVVNDMQSLKAQVRRWETNASLQWNDDDIAEVARHLNETIYRFPTPLERKVAAGGR